MESSRGKQVRDWTAFALGILGSTLGLLGFLHSRHNAKTVNKVEVAQLLAAAWDEMGGREGALEITSELRDARTDLEKFNLAYRKIEAALILDPDSAQAHFYKALNLELTGKLKEAAAAYEKIIELDPTWGKGYLGRGKIHLKNNDLDNAIIAARKAIEVDPDDDTAHGQLAYALFKKTGNDDEAMQRIERAIELAPHFGGYYHIKAHLLKEKGDVDGTIKMCRKTIKENPTHAGAYNTLGVALKSQGKNTEAVEAFRKATELNPDSSAAFNNLGDTLKELGDLAAAEKAYLRAKEIEASKL
jgi:tetratricopeptide (TPR) repeat protein